MDGSANQGRAWIFANASPYARAIGVKAIPSNVTARSTARTKSRAFVVGRSMRPRLSARVCYREACSSHHPSVLFVNLGASARRVSE